MILSVRLSLGISSLLLLLALFGCGEKTVVGQAGLKSEQSQACIECHQGAVSPGTGKLIAEEWKISHHNTFNGAGCADCHEPEPGHPTGCNLCHSGTPSGATQHVSNNPDRDAKCDKCHGRYNGYFSTLGARDAHFNNQTTGGSNPALAVRRTQYLPSYVTYEYTDKNTGKPNNCRKCHNPHDTTTARNHTKDFAGSAHGMIERIPAPTFVPTDGATPLTANYANNTFTFSPAASPSIYDVRIAPREENDFKTRGTTRSASDVSIESFGCIRCHTTTGYINFVNSGFSSLKSFGPVNPKTGAVYSSSDADQAPAVSGKEVVACNACHDNGAGTSYDFKKLRKVPAAAIYYNYTGNGVKITNHKYTYPDAGDSNGCVVCHSGRIIGLNIKMASAKGLNLSNRSRITNHYRGAAEMVFQSGGFEYYSSSEKYYGAGDPNFKYSHADIGMNRIPRIQTWLASIGITNNIGVNAGDKRSHGPCIGCHMNSAGKETSSHTFLPVNREAGASYRPGYPFQDDPARRPDPITKIVSNSCSACHNGTRSWTPEDLQYQKTMYEAAALAVREVLLYSLHTVDSKRTIDNEGRPAAPASNNWYGVVPTAPATAATVDTVQNWLRSTATDYTGTQGFRYPVISGDALSGLVLPVKKAAYNVGAYWNFWMMYADPGGYAHNDVYAKRLMYDTIDWLDDGILNLSVQATMNSGLPKSGFTGYGSPLNLKTRLGAATWQNAYNYLCKSDASLTDPGTENSGRPEP